MSKGKEMKNIYNGNLDIRTQADADKWRDLTEVTGYLYINSSAKLDAPALYSKGFDRFKIFDGIPAYVVSTKTKDGVDVLSCRQPRIRDGKIVGDRFYVAKQGDHAAHAKDIKTALEELAFKTGSRDVSQYRGLPLKTRKSPQQWALVYRTITGACQYGTQDFMQRKGDLKKSYTLEEILVETKGAYGHERFAEVVRS